MAEKKVVFVAFAIEDERQRDFLKGQSLHTDCPFEYIDMSVKEAYDGRKEFVHALSGRTALLPWSARAPIAPAGKSGRSNAPRRRGRN